MMLEVIKEMAGLDDMAEIVTYSRAWFYASKLDLKRMDTFKKLLSHKIQNHE